MLLLALAACTGEPAAPPPPAPPPPAPSKPTVPTLPAAAPVGVTEVRTPASVVRSADAHEAQGEGSVDACFDADVTTFDALGTWIDAWGLKRTDGDGRCWRIAST